MTPVQPQEARGDEEEVRSTFERFWTEQADLGDIDETGADILCLFEQVIPNIAGSRFLEVGSGSGRVSLALAHREALVTLLDNSQAAIDLSRSIFARHGQKAEFLLASAFEMPLPDNRFDVVWNSGVIEHFLFEDQVRMLREMLRVLKPDGTLITFNPSHQGRIYRFAKYLLEKTGKWPYGREIPIKTLGPHARLLGAHLVREFNAGFDLQFTYFLSRGMPLKDYFRRRPGLNAWMTRYCGGYLKVSVLKKSSSAPGDRLIP